MNYNPELPKFIKFEYKPQLGYLFVRYLFEEFPGKEVEGTYGFQYLGREISFMFPTRGGKYVLLPIGRATDVEEALKVAKQFLEKWLGHDPSDSGFRSEVTGKILRLIER